MKSYWHFSEWLQAYYDWKCVWGRQYLCGRMLLYSAAFPKKKRECVGFVFVVFNRFFIRCWMVVLLYLYDIHIQFNDNRAILAAIAPEHQTENTARLRQFSFDNRKSDTAKASRPSLISCPSAWLTGSDWWWRGGEAEHRAERRDWGSEWGKWIREKKRKADQSQAGEMRKSIRGKREGGKV